VIDGRVVWTGANLQDTLAEVGRVRALYSRMKLSWPQQYPDANEAYVMGQQEAAERLMQDMGFPLDAKILVKGEKYIQFNLTFQLT